MGEETFEGDGLGGETVPVPKGGETPPVDFFPGDETEPSNFGVELSDVQKAISGEFGPEEQQRVIALLHGSLSAMLPASATVSTAAPVTVDAKGSPITVPGPAVETANPATAPGIANVPTAPNQPTVQVVPIQATVAAPVPVTAIQLPGATIAAPSPVTIDSVIDAAVQKTDPENVVIPGRQVPAFNPITGERLAGVSGVDSPNQNTVNVPNAGTVAESGGDLGSRLDALDKRVLALEARGVGHGN